MNLPPPTLWRGGRAVNSHLYLAGIGIPTWAVVCPPWLAVTLMTLTIKVTLMTLIIEVTLMTLMVESQKSSIPPQVVLSQASGGMPTWAVFLVEGIRSGSVSTCTGVPHYKKTQPPRTLP